MKLYLPENYDPHLTVRETEEAIKYIRDTFQREIGLEMGLERVSAPVFLDKESGLNDDLSGVERKISFNVRDIPLKELEIVQSLAKWKRYALYEYGFRIGEGLYANMNAVRPDEHLDNLHSLYVDQWDWEKVISEEDRNEKTLREHVRAIFKVIKHMEHEVWYKYPRAVYRLPDDITFIDSEDLRKEYPKLDAATRESRACEKYGAVFVMRIGDKLGDGIPHDLRAPDYDDWQLNGDLLFWFEPLKCALEISSMGIRVSAKSMHEQLVKAGFTEREKLPFHRKVLDGTLPQSIGGGIGQSRLCMLLLGRVHVGEVSCSVWPEEMRRLCAEHNVNLL